MHLELHTRSSCKISPDKLMPYDIRLQIVGDHRISLSGVNQIPLLSLRARQVLSKRCIMVCPHGCGDNTPAIFRRVKQSMVQLCYTTPIGVDPAYYVSVRTKVSGISYGWLKL